MNIASSSPSMTSRPQRLRGVVVGAQEMANTIRVRVERLVWHPKIRKQYRVSKTYLVHDEKNEARVGDRVVIQHMRARSKRKHFRVLERTPGKQSLAEEGGDV